MSGWLLDTNIISELRRPRPDARVVRFVAGTPLEQLFISEVTFAEIRYGIELLDDPLRRRRIGQWLDVEMRPLFDGRVLRLDEEALLQWRIIIQQGRRKGHTFSHPDVLIAAVAARHGLTVVSRDVSDFMAAGVPVFNPWSDEQPRHAP